MTALYRMHDREPRGVFLVEPEDAHAWNRRGFGIFQTVNSFRGDERRIERLEVINAWAIDIDEGSKEEQAKRIERAPLRASRVIETKRGYQVYWRAKDAYPEHWNAIVVDRLVPWFGADKNARDIARILRAPGYYHLKNPAEPFLVREVFRWDVSYTEEQMASAFPVAPRRTPHMQTNHSGGKRPTGDDFWQRVSSLDCAAALERLSGHWAVGGERFTFRPCANGNRNILANGKGTSCWIDTSGRIGSLSDGGPTVYNWLKWYGHQPREIARVLKEVFPELKERS